MNIEVSYKPIPGLRSFRLMMLPDGPRLVGTVTRHVYDGPVAHQENAPPTRLDGFGDDGAENAHAYRSWHSTGFFAFAEDALNPGYVGGFFPVVGNVSFFGTVVRHRAGARGQTMRINKLWLAAGRWAQPQPWALYGEPFHTQLGIPVEAAAVYVEWPSALRTLLVPPAAGGPLEAALADSLSATYGCDVELFTEPPSLPQTLSAAGFTLCAKEGWKRPIHRTVLIDIPQKEAAR